jgi:hypothetical protein
LKAKIPTKGFKASYFDIKTKEIKFEQTLNHIHVDLGNANFRVYNEDSSTFHGIKPKDLGVYVAGYVHYPEETIKDIHIDCGHWSKITGVRL